MRFDFEKRCVELNNGALMPIVGLGTVKLGERSEEIVYEALKKGVRMIDTAQSYGNEDAVGRAVKRALADGIITDRSEVFIISKLVKANYGRCGESVEESLKNIDLDYIDLMLVHQLGDGDGDAYLTICDFVERGLIRAVGLSNVYDFDEFRRLAFSGIMPVLVQNENNVFFQNSGIEDEVREYGVVMEAYYSFCGRGATEEVFENETLRDIASVHNVTVAQVVLRWQLQNGYVVMPGADDPALIDINTDLFSFELDESEMVRISKLDRGIRHGNW